MFFYLVLSTGYLVLKSTAFSCTPFTYVIVNPLYIINRAPQRADINSLLPSAGPSRRTGAVARKETNLKGYETICILHPDLTEEEVKGTIERYSALISENGGEVTKSDHWGQRKLAYSVQGHSRGHYIYILYTGVAETVAELERNLRILDQNIRYMTVKVDDVEEMAKMKPQLLEDPTLSIQDGRDG